MTTPHDRGSVNPKAPTRTQKAVSVVWARQLMKRFLWRGTSRPPVTDRSSRAPPRHDPLGSPAARATTRH
ncbi:hypothetical protein BaRGS_00011733 [Batillaria attramentaria]|uniref:Uncharacterized protein n=1 Tax=Batillaria attramentaria TaxID=370345 RepID=A0ABD0LBQ8_9CAEN